MNILCFTKAFIVSNFSWIEIGEERSMTYITTVTFVTSNSHSDQTEQDENLHSEISMSEREVT